MLRDLYICYLASADSDFSYILLRLSPCIKVCFAPSKLFSHVAQSNETPSLPNPRAHLTPVRMVFPCVHTLPCLSPPKIPPLPKEYTVRPPITRSRTLQSTKLHHLTIKYNPSQCNKLLYYQHSRTAIKHLADACAINHHKRAHAAIGSIPGLIGCFKQTFDSLKSSSIIRILSLAI